MNKLKLLFVILLTPFFTFANTEFPQELIEALPVSFSKSIEFKGIAIFRSLKNELQLNINRGQDIISTIDLSGQNYVENVYRNDKVLKSHVSVTIENDVNIVNFELYEMPIPTYDFLGKTIIHTSGHIKYMLIKAPKQDSKLSIIDIKLSEKISDEIKFSLGESDLEFKRWFETESLK